MTKILTRNKKHFSSFFKGCQLPEIVLDLREHLWEWVQELSWFFACWLWCNNFLLDHHRTLYLWLLNASLLQLHLLDPLAVAGRSLSVFPSCQLSGCFTGIGSLEILTLVEVLEPLWSCAWQNQSFWKKHFLTQTLRKWAKKRVFEFK